jgi:hypothetical protein
MPFSVKILRHLTVSPTNKTDHLDITKILLKVTLSTIKQKSKQKTNKQKTNKQTTNMYIILHVSTKQMSVSFHHR